MPALLMLDELDGERYGVALVAVGTAGTDYTLQTNWFGVDFDRVVVYLPEDTRPPGDSLQAAYSAARDGYGAVLSRDGAGTTAAYVPSRSDAMAALPAGTMASFPESTVLDAVLGEEVIVILWCETAHPLAPLLAELSASGAVIAPAGCAVHRAALDKRASAP